MRLITIEGIRKFREMYDKGEELPKTWRNDIERYLIIKRKAIGMKKDEYLNALENLKEAKKIRDILYAKKY